jgi:predicted DNA-binding protein YlxM (UPF0122 family)
MKKRTLELDFIRLGALYKLYIKSLTFSEKEYHEYYLLMDFWGVEIITNEDIIRQNYKLYCFIRLCRTNISYRGIPTNLIVEYFNIRENNN